jgi:hypothetical protein
MGLFNIHFFIEFIMFIINKVFDFEARFIILFFITLVNNVIVMNKLEMVFNEELVYARKKNK